MLSIILPKSEKQTYSRVKEGLCLAPRFLPRPVAKPRLQERSVSAPQGLVPRKRS